MNDYYAELALIEMSRMQREAWALPHEKKDTDRPALLYREVREERNAPRSNEEQVVSNLAYGLTDVLLRNRWVRDFISA